MKNKLISKIIKYSSTTAGIAFISYFILVNGLISLGHMSHNGKEKIKSKEKLEELISLERKKFNPYNEFKIESELVNHTEGLSEMTGPNNYKITLGGECADISGVRHELYHIFDGHCKEVKSGGYIKNHLKYIFYYEPKAITYALTGIKL